MKTIHIILLLTLLLTLIGCKGKETDLVENEVEKPADVASTVEEEEPVIPDDLTTSETEAIVQEEPVQPFPDISVEDWETVGEPTLEYIGHSSVKIKTSKGVVVYIDPYYGTNKNYEEPADLVLVSHNHSDHNQVYKISKEKEFIQITNQEGIMNEVHQSFYTYGIKITSVPAYNDNHNKGYSQGFILEFDGIKLYHAGDTSAIPEMEALADMELTYALLPMDGQYNMGPLEAIEAAYAIAAKYYIPIHTGVDGYYSTANVEAFEVEGKIALAPGTTIELEKQEE